MLDTDIHQPELDDQPLGPAGRIEPRPPIEHRDSHRRRRFAALAVAVVTVAAVTGGVAGWLVADSTVGDDTGRSTSVEFTGESLDVAGVIGVAGDSILAIEVTIEYHQGPFVAEGSGAGTGIVLTSDGLVLTNAHVVNDATAVTVMLPGEDEPRDAELVGVSSDVDVAVIQVPGVTDLVPATFVDSDGVQVGDDVIAIGNALDLGSTMSVTKGIISALDRTIETDAGTYNGLIQTDAAISSGNSGGALLDPTGAVIGMNSAAAASSGGITAENIGFAIPSNRVLDAIAELGVSID